MSQPEFNSFDPVSAVMGAMHQGNMLAAKDAHIANLKAEVAALRKELADAQENNHLLNEATAKALKPTEALREAGDALWYCLRHLNRIDAEEIAEAIEDWQEARDKR